MTVKIIALIIGILIFGAGIFYFGKEKDDPESRKIYGAASIIGAVIAAGAAALMIL